MGHNATGDVHQRIDVGIDGVPVTSETLVFVEQGDTAYVVLPFFQVFVRSYESATPANVAPVELWHPITCPAGSRS